jgi:DNA polymerase-3 subunit beta
VTAAAVVERPAEVFAEVELKLGALTRAMSLVRATQPSRVMVPVLASVRLDQGDDGVWLSAYDGRSCLVRTRVGPPMSPPGSVLLDREAFASVVASLRRGVKASQAAEIPVLISPLTETTLTAPAEVTVAADGYRFAVATRPIEDYPPGAERASGKGAQVDRDLLARAVSRADRAAGRDGTLPMLTGINVEASDGKLTLASTDRFRLTVSEVPAVADEWQALVPSRLLAEVTSRLPAGPVTLALADIDGRECLSVAAGGVVALLALIPTEFVKYRSLLPTDSTSLFTVDRAAMIQLCERLAPHAGRYGHLRLTIGTRSLRASTGTDYSSARSPEIPIELQGAAESDPAGDVLTIAFAPQYLLDGLRSLTGPRVALGMTTPARPAVMAESLEDLSPPSGSNPFRYLVMPARLGREF